MDTNILLKTDDKKKEKRVIPFAGMREKEERAYLPS
jgi:hypothetical protein